VVGRQAREKETDKEWDQGWDQRVKWRDGEKQIGRDRWGDTMREGKRQTKSGTRG